MRKAGRSAFQIVPPCPYSTPIAVILQYGHGTRNGGYVQGVDYINPAMKPVFDAIRDELWKEVTK